MSSSSWFLRRSKALFAAARSAAQVSNVSPSTLQKSTTSAAAAASKAPKRSKEKKRAISGIMKTTPVSPTLQSLVGAPEASRIEAVKKVWEYIKLHNLQNPMDKREIFCDAKLKKLFDGKEKVGFLEIGKLLTPHFVKVG